MTKPHNQMFVEGGFCPNCGVMPHYRHHQCGPQEDPCPRCGEPKVGGDSRCPLCLYCCVADLTHFTGNTTT